MKQPDFRNVTPSQLPPDLRPDFHEADPPVYGNPMNSFICGLKSIFESLVVQPDFSRCYERDLHRRLHVSWARVGHSMQFALGKPVTFSVMSPDGRRMIHVVAPDTSDAQYQAALHRARETAPDPDPEAGTSSNHVAIRVTRKQAAGLMAHAGGAARNGSGR